MNVIDIILGVILLFGLIRGLMKGFFVELASLVALIAGVYGAIHFSYILKGFLFDLVSWDEKYVQLVAFALTFIIIVVLISLLGKLLTKFSSLIALGFVNRLLGAVFGFLKMAFFLSIIILFFDGFNQNGAFLEKQKVDTSVLYEPVKNFVPMLLPAVLDQARKNNWVEEDKTYFGN
ncbi:MAG TPA: CvpA family protein [Flavobacteriaceae bacterium]|nr:CvpA family protein [Flavobacteriaceae bacterium]